MTSVVTRSPEAELAFSTEARIKRTITQLREQWARLAEDLLRFSEEKMWRRLGYDSFEAWLADPEVEVDRRWAYTLIGVWRQFVVVHGADPQQIARLTPTKLDIVLPAVRQNYVPVNEALEDVEILSRGDLKEKYRPRAEAGAAEPGRPDTTTHLDAESEPSWVRCPTCGNRCREDDLR